MKQVLVTGATGSFGKAFVKNILESFPDIQRLVVFSRDELKQFEMQQQFSAEKYRAIRYFLGDVRDQNRLYRALDGIDTVVHAAALKQVPAAEYNPMEFVNTNVMGAQNVVEACIDRGVENVVALSTDKACSPVNLYGATKLCSDKIFVAANAYGGGSGPKFSVVRYGNVMGSRGSVIPFFMEKRKEKVLPITDPEMTRFNITLSSGVDMVRYAIENAIGGEIYVPKIPSYRILDVAKAVCSESEVKIVGIRPGEKLHEEMISSSDSSSTLDLGEYYVILPSGDQKIFDYYLNDKSASKVEAGFQYNSGTNEEFLTVDELRDLIDKHIDIA